jgi:hypothetical protein
MIRWLMGIALSFSSVCSMDSMPLHLPIPLLYKNRRVSFQDPDPAIMTRTQLGVLIEKRMKNHISHELAVLKNDLQYLWFEIYRLEKNYFNIIRFGNRRIPATFLAKISETKNRIFCLYYFIVNFNNYWCKGN